MNNNNPSFVEKNNANKFFKYMKSFSYNNKCADCSRSSPIWISVPYGLFICSDCASKHRELHIKVKSTLLDRWTIQELQRIYVSGNKLNYKLEETDINLKYKDTEWYIKDIDNLKCTDDIFDLKCENIKENRIDVEEIPISKLGDPVKFNNNIKEKKIKNEIKSNENNKTNVKFEEKFVVKKNNTPKISKNKKYEVSGDLSRLGFLNSNEK